MAGEGQKLRVARESKGWTIADAEEATKIRIRYLQALEEENYAILPGTAYIKGFLRTYANYLGLDPNEILADYKSSFEAEPAPAAEPALKPIRTRSSVWLRPLAVVIMACVAIGIVIAVASFMNKPDNKQGAYEPAALPTPPTQDNTATPNTSNQSPDISPNPNSATQPPAQTNAPATEGLDAKVTVTAACWVNVSIDGGAPAQETYQAGTVKELKANSKIEFVTIGNPLGIRINLNGHDLPAFTSGTVINNYVLTADTLKTLGQ